MIVLDTNQLLATRIPGGALLTALRAIADHAGHALVLPDIVLEEYLANYTHSVDSSVVSFTRAHAALRDVVPSWALQQPAVPDPDAAANERDQIVRRIFGVLPCSGEVARAALRRETWRQRPASRNWDKPGAGARDVAVWLTTLAACHDEAADRVYFVSSDGRAFGGAAGLPAELAAEAPENLVYCAGIEPLLAQLAAKTQPPAPVEVLAADPLVRDAVRHVVMAPEIFMELGETVQVRTGHMVLSHVGTDEIELVGHSDAHAYQVSAMTWVSVSTRWKITTRYAWRPIIVAGTTVTASMRAVQRAARTVTFELWATLLLQCSDNGGIASAEVTSRGPVAIVDVNGETD